MQHNNTNNKNTIAWFNVKQIDITFIPAKFRFEDHYSLMGQKFDSEDFENSASMCLSQIYFIWVLHNYYIICMYLTNIFAIYLSIIILWNLPLFCMLMLVCLCMFHHPSIVCFKFQILSQNCFKIHLINIHFICIFKYIWYINSNLLKMYCSLSQRNRQVTISCGWTGRRRCASHGRSIPVSNFSN